MKLKVCGITSVEQLEALNEIGADLAGLIFVRSSPRHAYDKLASRKEEVKKNTIAKVGVFVNERLETVKGIIDEFALDYVQLHGDEDPDYASEVNKKVPVIKAFRINDDVNISNITKPFENACSYYLFDTFSENNFGGTGKKFNWRTLEANISKPFFLSGGISPEDANAIRELTNPSLYAVDINSKFETEPGVKDMDLVRSFKKQLDQVL